MSLKSAIKKGMGNPNCGIRVLLGPDGPGSTFFCPGCGGLTVTPGSGSIN